jgi:hypothetical protein
VVTPVAANSGAFEVTLPMNSRFVPVFLTVRFLVMVSPTGELAIAREAGTEIEAVGVAVAVAVGVSVAVAVAVAVGVAVAVAVGISVGVPVGVAVAVGVSVGVPVGVAVAVGVAVRLPLGLPWLSQSLYESLLPWRWASARQSGLSRLPDCRIK